MGRRRDDRGYTLRDAYRDGQHVSVRCSRCKTKRWFLPADLRYLFGDIQIDNLKHRLTCERCGKVYLDVDVRLFSAEERSRLTVRRIAEVYHVKRVRWRDERP